jgi:hypothetical protein
MSGPDRRLLDGEATEFERALLGSWHARQPSSEARARTLARVGMGVGAAAVAATTAKTAGGSIAPKAVVASSALLKWIGFAAIGTSVTVGTLAYVHHDRQLEASRSSSAAEPAENGPRPAPAVTAPASSGTVSTPTAIELGPDMARGAVPAVHSKSAPTTAKSTLDDEVAMVAEARQAEATGNPASAIQLLDAYDLKYPNGSLARESTEIRIQALIQEGNRPAAERLAARFIASHPSSLDVRNIRRALDPDRPERH